jgi:hypothetical protein
LIDSRLDLRLVVVKKSRGIATRRPNKKQAMHITPRMAPI